MVYSAVAYSVDTVGGGWRVYSITMDKIKEERRPACTAIHLPHLGS
jgi:hypothetical protein